MVFILLEKCEKGEKSRRPPCTRIVAGVATYSFLNLTLILLPVRN